MLQIRLTGTKTKHIDSTRLCQNKFKYNLLSIKQSLSHPIHKQSLDQFWWRSQWGLSVALGRALPKSALEVGPSWHCHLPLSAMTLCGHLRKPHYQLKHSRILPYGWPAITTQVLWGKKAKPHLPWCSSISQEQKHQTLVMSLHFISFHNHPGSTDVQLNVSKPSPIRILYVVPQTVVLMTEQQTGWGGWLKSQTALKAAQEDPWESDTKTVIVKR